MQLVRDDDDRLAVVAHPAQDAEQLLGLLRGEHGGRLVEDEDVRAAVEHLDDLHRLLFGDRHLVDLLHRVDLKAVLLADLLDAPRRLLQAETPAVLKTEDDVFGGGEDINQLEVLVNHADAVCKCVLRRTDDDRLPVDEDLARIREIDARDHVHQRGLAAAVLTEDGEDLAAVDLQADVVVGDDAAEGLRDPAQLDGGDLIVVQIRFLRNRT